VKKNLVKALNDYAQTVIRIIEIRIESIGGLHTDSLDFLTRQEESLRNDIGFQLYVERLRRPNDDQDLNVLWAMVLQLYHAYRAALYFAELYEEHASAERLSSGSQ
jgi:hypothetical protein